MNKDAQMTKEIFMTLIATLAMEKVKIVMNILELLKHLISTDGKEIR